jgi:hypothetical protein
MQVDFVAVSAIVGALLPIVVSIVKKEAWSTQIKRVITIVLAMIAAVVTTGVAEGWTELSFANLTASATLIFVAANTTYNGFWSDTTVDRALTSAFDKTAFPTE